MTESIARAMQIDKILTYCPICYNNKNPIFQFNYEHGHYRICDKCFDIIALRLPDTKVGTVMLMLKNLSFNDIRLYMFGKVQAM